MRTAPAHISSVDHLEKLIQEVLQFSQPAQPLQLSSLELVIRRHVEFMGSTRFPPENLSVMTNRIFALAKRLYPYAKNNSINGILSHCAELNGNLLIRQIQRLADSPRRDILAKMTEQVLLGISDDSSFKDLFGSPRITKSTINRVLRTFDEQ